MASTLLPTNSLVPSAFSDHTSEDFYLEDAQSMTDSETPADEVTFLVYKNDQQHGPYSQEHILNMLQAGQIAKKDLIYFEGLGGWKPLDEVFEIEEQLAHSMDEGQDPEIVADIYRHIEPMITRDEEILYIAHQRKKRMRSRSDGAIITNKRLIIMYQTLTGTSIEDCMWKNVVSVHMKEGMLGTTFSVLDMNDHVIEVEDIPKEQIARLCQLAQEMRM